MKVVKTFCLAKARGVLNEFYVYKQGFNFKGIGIRQYKRILLGRFAKILENQGVLYNNDEDGAFRHMFVGMMRKKLKKLNLKSFCGLRQNFKAYMKLKDFRDLYYILVSLIFSFEINEISDMLGIKCCLNSQHYDFCKYKWEELWKFSQNTMVKQFGLTPSKNIKVYLKPYKIREQDVFDCISSE
jgi:hypothetical protein